MNTQLLQKPEVHISCFARLKKKSGEFFLVSLKKNRGTKISLFRCLVMHCKYGILQESLHSVIIPQCFMS